MKTLKLLLDEHISPAVAHGLAKAHPGAIVESLPHWRHGSYLGVSDAQLLEAAFKHRYALVTYDQSTIVPLLKNWAEQGIDHGGVIFIDERTIAPNNFGAIIRALGQLLQSKPFSDSKNQVVYLSKACAKPAH